VLDSQLLQNSDDYAANVVASSVGGGERRKQELQRPLLVALVEGRKGIAQVRFGPFLELDSRGQAIGSAASADVGEDLSGFFALASRSQELGKRDSRVRTARL
jgi:hypothetical protein